MKLERKHAWFLLLVAAWLVLTWARFIRVLVTTHGEQPAFYIAHAVLIAVNFAIALVLGWWGWVALRSGRHGR